MTTMQEDRTAEGLAARKTRVAIFGAGITGLSAAKRLRELAPNVELVVWDRADRVGGVIGTRFVDGFLCETSVDNFITTVPQGLELCKDLGFQVDEQSIQAHLCRLSWQAVSASRRFHDDGADQILPDARDAAPFAAGQVALRARIAPAAPQVKGGGISRGVREASTRKRGV